MARKDTRDPPECRGPSPRDTLPPCPLPPIPTSPCATMSGCSASCSGKRSAPGKGRRASRWSSASAPWPRAAAPASGSDFDDAGGASSAAMPLDEVLPVARAFSQFLNLANIAEQHHRIRRRRAYQQAPDLPPQRGSCEETFGRLIAAGLTPADLRDAVCVARDRAGADRAPDRDRPPHAAAEVRPHRPRAGREGSSRPDRSGSARPSSRRCAARLPPAGRPTRSGGCGRRRSTRSAAACWCSSRRCGRRCRATCASSIGP